MYSTNDIQTYGVQYLWNDETIGTPPHFGLIGVATTEVLNYLFEMLEAENPEWSEFDRNILYYLDSSKGETVEQLSSFDSPAEFMVFDLSEEN